MRPQSQAVLELAKETGLVRPRDLASRGIAETAKRIPNGIVCFLSALRLHGLTTQEPFEVWPPDEAALAALREVAAMRQAA